MLTTLSLEGTNSIFERYNIIEIFSPSFTVDCYAFSTSSSLSQKPLKIRIHMNIMGNGKVVPLATEAM